MSQLKKVQQTKWKSKNKIGWAEPDAKNVENDTICKSLDEFIDRIVVEE